MVVSIEDHVHVPFETIVGLAYNNKYFPYTCTLTLTFWLNTVVTVLEGNNGPPICDPILENHPYRGIFEF